MKEFMYIFKGPAYSELNFSPEVMQTQMQRWFGWVEELKAKGVYVEGRPLMNEGKRVAGKKQLVTDGPFAESKELVGGYFIIKAKDIDEAVSLTKNFPDFDYDGSVEVREIAVYDNMPA